VGRQQRCTTRWSACSLRETIRIREYFNKLHLDVIVSHKTMNKHGRNLVGGHGGHNMPCPPTFFSLGFVFAKVSKIKVVFVTFCVKSFSC